MALDPVTKVEITAHTSIIDELLEKLQECSIMQVDPLYLQEWESEKAHIHEVGDRIADLRRDVNDVNRALAFLDRYKPRVSMLQKLNTPPDVFSKGELKAFADEHTAKEIELRALDTEREISDIDNKIRELRRIREELEPLRELDVPLSLLAPGGGTSVLISKLDGEVYRGLLQVVDSDLMHVERISGGENSADTVYFAILCHREAADRLDELERDFRLEPISLDPVERTPRQLLDEHEGEIAELERSREEAVALCRETAREIKALRFYEDYLSTELEKEAAKEKLFFTEKVFMISGWVKQRDLTVLKTLVNQYREAYVSEVPIGEDETPPVAYRNNPVVSPFEIIVNLYSPPSPKEVDPTPVLMPFYTVFFGVCLTEAGYGLVVALISLVGMLLIKQKTPFRKFLSMFFILGLATTVIGALIGSFFGINFEALPENLAWLREARYKIMLFDSGKDVLKFFALSLGLGVIHLIAGYLIKMYMLFRDGEWVEALCDHLPWVILLLAPVPKVLSMFMPDRAGVLNVVFYIMLALWALILLFFSERSSWNPVKRIGKGIFTLYGVSGVLADVLSYSRLLALGLATGVIAGVMNTLAIMVKDMPIVGIIGFFVVLLVGHLFNLFISGLSAFVHSIRLQFMEFFTKFYTGGGELLTAFSEKRKYTYKPSGS
jgi:V/A-type H+-transporting ATPase subunit I